MRSRILDVRCPPDALNVIYSSQNLIIFAPIESPEQELLIGAKMIKFREESCLRKVIVFLTFLANAVFHFEK